MKSHSYLFSARELAGAVLPTLVAAGGILAAIKSADFAGWLPAKAVSAQNIFYHQARACLPNNPAAVLMVGDSTCMMGADAIQLSRYLPGNAAALNLGLIREYGFDVDGKQVADFAAANPGSPRAVVVLVYPGSLVLPKPADGMARWQELEQDAGVGIGNKGWNGLTQDPVGLAALRHRLLDNLVELPYRKNGAEGFVFPSEYEAHMTARRGSLFDSGVYRPADRLAHAHWKLLPQVAGECDVFRSEIPSGIRVIVGLTPTPEGEIPTDELPEIAELRNQWAGAIRADNVLTNLPLTLPVRYYGTTAHFNEEGQRYFTKLLGRELAPLLAPAKGSEPSR
jgi:hypothetical protein